MTGDTAFFSVRGLRYHLISLNLKEDVLFVSTAAGQKKPSQQ